MHVNVRFAVRRKIMTGTRIVISVLVVGWSEKIRIVGKDANVLYAESSVMKAMIGQTIMNRVRVAA